eukprot:gnl/TRDRNA2_/TRDRNA2_32576_c0_seq1.p1 gnl/TRDRNA2_/TRDRNA2_32576_c0~~gnl/TRDRNA2_/TRDRNA2_32576_c0_seq1.p1  ORF type:complete len:247 (+),score=50.87 gnl/TRDRNA2_/TRDRNA2_32576_c0_seq1:49-789(+)
MEGQTQAEVIGNVAQAPEVASMGEDKRGVLVNDVEKGDQPKSCFCCKQGGCCSQAPPREVIENGRVIRLNVLFNTGPGLFGRSRFFSDKDCEDVPFYLKKKGLSMQQWQQACNELMQVDPYQVPFIFFPLMIPVFLLIALCWFCLAPLIKKKDLQKDKILREWQAKFNKVLEPLGIFCKTQSNCVERISSKGDKDRYIERWVAFSLDVEDAKRLKLEPHVQGKTENSSCCGGTNEADLCMHPWLIW